MITAISILVVGFLFATLQYPASMKKFWGWAAVALGCTVAVLAGAIATMVGVDVWSSDATSIDWWNLCGRAFVVFLPFVLAGCLVSFKSKVFKTAGWIVGGIGIIFLASAVNGMTERLPVSSRLAETTEPSLSYGPWEDYTSPAISHQEKAAKAPPLPEGFKLDSQTIVRTEAYRRDGSRVTPCLLPWMARPPGDVTPTCPPIKREDIDKAMAKK